MTDHHRALLFLKDMRKYAATACRISQGLSEEEFRRSEEKQLAIIRAVEIIGEAAKGVPPELRA